MSLFYMPLFLASLLCGTGGGAGAETCRHEGATPPAATFDAEMTRPGSPAVSPAVASTSEAAGVRVEPAPRRRSTGRRAMPQQRTLEQILNDPALWGKDFPTALASLPGFSAAGERRVAVFPDRVVGDVRYKTRAAAEQKARQLDRGMKSNQLKFRPQFQSLGVAGAAAPQNVQQLSAQAIRLIDDNTTRLAAVAPSAQMLPPDLNMATVRQRLGQPTRVTTELLDDGTERRPVILTLYHYAGGNVVFAVSDVKPGPGSVDRVYINVPAVTAVVFRR